jgi:hypothetical protein
MLALYLAGCPTRTQVGQYKCSDLWKSFFLKKSPETQMAEFTQYDLEKQYAIYICGQEIEPPLIELARPFAREGEKVVPLLKAKLLAAPNDPTIRDIVNVFAEMSRQQTYDVVGDADLMNIIEKSVGRIKDPYWKQFSEKKLSQIRRK